ITPALITGAFVERFKFTTYMLFLVIWVSIVYAPIAHWVWGGGWLGDVGDKLPEKVDLVFAFEENEWQGRQHRQLNLKDVCAAA
ncbi:MAG: hypothetical protein QGG31_01725, partial [Anaerolineales bacterium]|nr:hypothetical protein [Anaerolineales bacterium]